MLSESRKAPIKNMSATMRFKRLKKRTPFLRPVTTETVAIRVMIVIIIICVFSPEEIPKR